MVAFTTASIAEAVRGRLVGDAALVLSGVAPLDVAGPADLSFLSRDDYRARARASAAGCTIVARESDLPGRCVIVVADSHRAFADAMRVFHPQQMQAPGVSADASIAPTARLGEGVHVGSRVVIGAGTLVGKGSVVLPGAVIGENCEIGDACVLHPGVVLYPRTRIGSRVIVHANAVLGSDGFGYSSSSDGHLKIPHAGCVVVEDDVEIGAGTCVDRAVMGETRIGRGTKIDNLVQVAHNVILGEHVLLVAQSGISGSTRLGRFVVVAGQSGVAGHLELGDGARVAAKSAALQDVAAGETVAGIPAGPHARWKRLAAALTRLPELLHRVKRIETRLGLAEAEATPSPEESDRERA